MVGGLSRAYPFKGLARRPVVEERLGDVDLTLWFDTASRSAAAFDRRLGERTLGFRAAGPATFEDSATKSRWNLEGKCVAGPLEGQRLRPLHGLMAEWYGWYAHYPATTVWDGGRRGASK